MAISTYHRNKYIEKDSRTPYRRTRTFLRHIILFTYYLNRRSSLLVNIFKLPEPSNTIATLDMDIYKEHQSQLQLHIWVEFLKFTNTQTIEELGEYFRTQTTITSMIVSLTSKLSSPPFQPHNPVRTPTSRFFNSEIATIPNVI